jgi:predicted nucleic acid-binding protein
LILDTSVLIAGERGAEPLDFSRWEHLGDAFISAVTVSELLAGVHLADTEKRRLKRLSFVEGFLARVPVLDFTPEVARVHAEVFAVLWRKGDMIGAHDLMIAATALAHGHAVLTDNTADFGRVPGLTVLAP